MPRNRVRYVKHNPREVSNPDTISEKDSLFEALTQGFQSPTEVKDARERSRAICLQLREGPREL